MASVRELDMSRLGTLGGALGDPTRFSLYRHVVSSPEPLSAGEVAEVFGLHRTVARSHLEKLTEAGLLRIGARRKPGGGRPAKIYSASPDRLEIQLPPRRYESLSQMLVRLAQRLDGGAVELARKVGWEHGRDLARGLPRSSRRGRRRPSLDAVMRVLEDHGCSPRVVEAADGRVVMEVGNCLYLEVAADAPEIVCGLSSGMLCGLLGCDLADHRQTLSIIDGHDVCRHEFVV